MSILPIEPQDTDTHYASITELPLAKQLALLEEIRERRLRVIAGITRARRTLAENPNNSETLKNKFIAQIQKLEQALNKLNDSMIKIEANYNKLCVMNLQMGGTYEG